MTGHLQLASRRINRLTIQDYFFQTNPEFTSIESVKRRHDPQSDNLEPPPIGCKPASTKIDGQTNPDSTQRTASVVLARVGSIILLCLQHTFPQVSKHASRRKHRTSTTTQENVKTMKTKTFCFGDHGFIKR